MLAYKKFVGKSTANERWHNVKSILKLCIGLIFASITVGCIAENYDFDPPILSLISDEKDQSIQLELVNLDWSGERHTPIKKETEDLTSVVKHEEALYSKSREQVKIQFSHLDFYIHKLSMTLRREQNDVSNSLLWKNNEEKDWQVSFEHFITPLEKGDFMLIIDLKTDRGTAQYVGKLVIE